MLTFHRLRVSDLRPEASDAVCITFEVPDELRETYRFSPGQHVGIRANIDGHEIRRTYSICSATDERHLRIGVRVHDQGSMTRYLAKHVRVGDLLEVMKPIGRFFLEPDPHAKRSYCAFAAGSGITPILGILNSVLKREPNSRFLLFYGNRSTGTIMFAEELLALKDRYPQRLSLNFIMSREPQEVELFNGRLDAQKVAQLGRELFDPGAIDAYFVCGPGTMIDSVREALAKLGVEQARVHTEHFVSDAARPTSPAEPMAAPADTASRAEAATRVTIVMDGRRRTFSMGSGDATVLEAAERAGIELPYSCRAGVCSTCRTRVVHGAVTMATNYALEPWEVEAGYVLCCQALPVSPELELNYDER